MDHLPYPTNPAHDRLQIPLFVDRDTVVDCRYDMLDETSARFSRLPATRQSDKSVGRKEISEGDDGEPEVFTRIWNDLASRSTTRTVDRLSILSLLVDLRPSDVRREHPRARLKAIFKAQEKLPLALLFQPPLTADEKAEASNEFSKEEEAEISRGKDLRPYEEDASYPLPTSLRSKQLPGQLGWMQQEGDFIFFDNDLLSAGIRRPSLFRLPFSQVEGFTTCRLQDRSVGSNGCVFDMHLDSFEMDEDGAKANTHLYLLTSSGLEAGDAYQSSHTTFYGVLLTLEEPVRRHFGVSDQTRDIWLWRYLCHVTCDTFEVLDTDQPVDLTHHEDIERELFASNCEYRIHCDFSNVSAPSHHLIRGFVEPENTAFNIRVTIMPILCIYYLVCFGFTCIPVFAHTPGTFPKGWLAMIGWLVSIRWLYFTFNGQGQYKKASNEIKFNAWVNGIGDRDGGGPIIDSQRRHTGFNVNLSLRETLGLTFLCSIFIIAGAAKYDNHGVRWMVAVGSYGPGELLLSWWLELCLPTSRFWGALDEPGRPELPALRAAYLSPSRLTRWLKGLVRSE